MTVTINDENQNTLYAEHHTRCEHLREGCPMRQWVEIQRLKQENRRLKEELRQLRTLAVLKGAQ